MLMKGGRDNMKGNLTEKQQIFADEYLKDLNGTRAYKVAYPNVKKDSVAAAAAARMLRNVKVKTYIEEQLEKMHDARSADAQEVIEYLTSVMRGESISTVVQTEFVGEGISEIKLVEKPPDEKERLKAAELLGKRHALFTEKQQIEVTETPVFVDDLSDVDG